MFEIETTLGPTIRDRLRPPYRLPPRSKAVTFRRGSIEFLRSPLLRKLCRPARPVSHHFRTRLTPFDPLVPVPDFEVFFEGVRTWLVLDTDASAALQPLSFLFNSYLFREVESPYAASFGLLRIFVAV